MKFFRSGCILFAAAALLAVPALAQTNAAYYQHQRGMNESFSLDIGGFFQTFDTTISLSNAAGTEGTSINLENDLGHSDRQTSIAADGYWRFGRHGRLDFAYRGWSRSNSQALARDIVVGDTTYHAGAQVDSRMRVTLGELYYSYSFVNDGDLEFGLGLGLSAYVNSFEISGTGSITGPGGGGAASGSAESRSLTAPIPALKAYFVYTLYPRVFLKASAKGISGTVSGYHGEMWDYRGGLDYLIGENVGIGGQYQYTKISFSHAGTSANLAFDYKYSGPLAYVIIAF